ncbi:hypothetical protein SKAU_G00121640 [Synaphobranchus kaupii]|uniref:CRIB domain-containing protein n=1 Tax=Synaphobranchus kaupii TaxID=118154 RepID=A0A9Q1J2G3_SYNKA|nr:hypothetical protein SKAU_G00121640 [Synaphobranchus kaupii]
MSLGKLPGIKSLVSTSQRRRRFKKDLSADMISPPMGDFRHTMHVGRGGDVFGDTSFLSNHGGTGNGAVGDPVESPSAKTAGFFSRTLRHVRKTPTLQRAVPPDVSPPPPPISPIIKNAVSLPRLDADAPNGRLQRVLFPSSPNSPEDSTCTFGVESGFATLPRLSRNDGSGTCRSEFRRSWVPDDIVLPLLHCDSMTSFTVDLGPSLMSEVFGMIDSPDGGRDASHIWGKEEKREEEEEEEKKPRSPRKSCDLPREHPSDRLSAEGRFEHARIRLAWPRVGGARGGTAHEGHPGRSDGVHHEGGAGYGASEVPNGRQCAGAPLRGRGAFERETGDCGVGQTTVQPRHCGLHWTCQEERPLCLR